MDPTEDTAPPRLKAQWARTIILHSLLAGLCPLIPIPWVDDAVLGNVRRRMVRTIMSAFDLDPSRSYVEILTRERPRGCVEGCLVGLVVYPVKKIFRKIFIVLTIKECVDEASKTFHLGYLVHLALERGEIDAACCRDDGTRLRAIRSSMDRTLAEIDTRPLTRILGRAFRGSRALMRSASRRFWSAVKPSRKHGEEAVDEAIGTAHSRHDPEMESLLDRLSREIWLEQGYLEDLDNTWARCNPPRPDDV